MHDVGTPLTTFTLAIEHLRSSRLLKSDDAETIRMCESAIELMRLTQNKVVDYARFYAGQVCYTAVQSSIRTLSNFRQTSSLQKVRRTIIEMPYICSECHGSYGVKMGGILRVAFRIDLKCHRIISRDIRMTRFHDRDWERQMYGRWCSPSADVSCRVSGRAT